ncbi:MAG: site-specific integrase [Paludibacteraceae bacterium]|nr:site-specific integrase [Paludibacteraceae bacterium]MBR1786657.1 site-specific integrase [Paludibacteraceae bacterium]
MLNKIRYKLVFNRARRLNKRGEGLIEIECSQQKRRIYFSTHTYVQPEYFSNGSVTGTPNADSLNYALCLMIQEVERVELEYIKKGVDVHLPMLREAVRQHISPAAKLSDFGTQVVEQSERKNLTKQNYQTLFNNIEKFRKGTLITDVDYQFVVAYDKWLRDSEIAHNTRISRLRLLRAILNEAKKRDIIPVNPFDRFRIQQMVSKKGFLTIEQLHRLEKMTLKGIEDKVRDAFLIGCYTGLRFSDVITLRSEHIKDGWLTKKMVKTGFIVEIPCAELFNGKMLQLVDKYNGKIERLTKALQTNSSVNKTLRQVLDRLKIDSKITFHSSRHTFATLLSQNGVQITTIQKLLGHQKLQTTQIYSEVDRKAITNDLKKGRKK